MANHPFLHVSREIFAQLTMLDNFFFEPRLQRETFPVRVGCDAMGVSPALYYAWRGRPESPRKGANRALLTEIRRVHATHSGRYGAPRINAALRAEGQTASPSRVG